MRTVSENITVYGIKQLLNISNFMFRFIINYKFLMLSLYYLKKNVSIEIELILFPLFAN